MENFFGIKTKCLPKTMLIMEHSNHLRELYKFMMSGQE